jgi:glycerophosphoryl diester phosphodiesterase
MVANYTLEELSQFTAGYPNKFGDKYLDLKIPTFKDALLLLAQYPDAVMIMDLKQEGLGASIAQALYEVEQLLNISAQGELNEDDSNALTSSLADRIVASCWTETQVADISSHLNISVRQMLGSVPGGKLSNGYFADLLHRHVHSFSLYKQSLTRSFVRAAHLRMMPVFAWTVNEQLDVMELLAQGVDGLISDNPQQVKEWIYKKEDDDDQWDTGSVVLLSFGCVTGGFLFGFLSLGSYLVWKHMRSRSTQYLFIPQTK